MCVCVCVCGLNVPKAPAESQQCTSVHLCIPNLPGTVARESQFWSDQTSVKDFLCSAATQLSHSFPFTTVFSCLFLFVRYAQNLWRFNPEWEFSLLHFLYGLFRFTLPNYKPTKLVNKFCKSYKVPGLLARLGEKSKHLGFKFWFPL